MILVESVREKVQLNFPDAESGLAKEDQNRACTVMSNYLDKGKVHYFLISIYHGFSLNFYIQFDKYLFVYFHR